jgi:hypothetical protein
MRWGGYWGLPPTAIRPARACLWNVAKRIADAARSDFERRSDRMDDREGALDVALAAIQQGDSMDNCRFDNLTREIATRADRRTALKALAGGIAALATLVRVELGLAQEVGIQADCTFNGNACRRDSQCCSLNCNRRNRCKCAGAGARCQTDAGCCTGYCRGATPTCRCIPNDSPVACQTHGDCCSRNCRNGTCRCIQRGDLCRSSSQCCNESRCPNGDCTCKLVSGRQICA